MSLILGHTSTSPKHYSHMGTNSSGVSLTRSSVRTWFPLHAWSICHAASSRSCATRWKGALNLHRSQWLSRAPWLRCGKRKCENSHCLKDVSELRALCVHIYARWMLCVYLKDRFIESSSCRQISPALAYYVMINRPPPILEGVWWNLILIFLVR